MCSKKWAKPDLPGSTSLRDPVRTGIWIETMLGKPVGTTMTLRPFGSVRSTAGNGSSPRGSAVEALGIEVVRRLQPTGHQGVDLVLGLDRDAVGDPVALLGTTGGDEPLREPLGLGQGQAQVDPRPC